MKIIIGLGNPGAEYQSTRHNAGFIALDYILKEYQPISCASKFSARISEIHQPKKTLFAYPETYMNESGKAVKELLNFYKLTPKDILVLHDEVDLPLGTLKLTESSGHAGHNGIRSLIDELGTQDFKRIRIGIESREDKNQLPTEAFVLQNFTPEQLRSLPLEEIKARVEMELRS